MTITSFNGVEKAYIKDRTENEATFVKTGETIGDCKVIEILAQKKSVRLKPTEGPEFTIKYPEPKTTEP